MSQPEFVSVTDREGLPGFLVETGESQAVVRLEGGKKVLVPMDALVLQEDGSYYLKLSLAELERQLETQPKTGETSDDVIIPAIEEELEVGKRQVETGRVQIKKVVHEREEVVDEPLLKEEVEVERVSVNRLVEEPSGIRYEGDRAIIPLYEEVLVVEKRLMLTEELHVIKRQVETRDPQRVSLRREEAVVERKEDS